MIEIQCTSCHTRYRIDERVLPADSPTFKCSRCGHVFTTDPIATKKASSEPPSKVATPRVPNPRPEPPTPTAPVDSSREVPQANAPTSQTSSPEAATAPEPKPAPVKPYIRNQRPTVFDRTPEPTPPKTAPEPTADIDADAVESMRAAVEAPTAKAATPPKKAVPKTLEEWNREADATGENLEFDFNDENPPPELGDEPTPAETPAAAERWSVGDDAPQEVEEAPTHPSAFGSGELDPEFSRGEPAPIGRGTIPQYAGAGAVHHAALPDERSFVERAALYTARSFLGAFLVVMAIFVVLTGLICVVPSASAELLRRMPVIGAEFVQTTPIESLVSVSDVQSSYQAVKGGQEALVIAGLARNNSEVALHTVQIGVRLLDASHHDLAQASVYCGPTLSPKMIGEMTPHELEFLQKLDPQKNFVLENGHTAPFLLVVIDPPRNLSHFAVAVAKAQPSSTAPASAR